MMTTLRSFPRFGETSRSKRKPSASSRRSQADSPLSEAALRREVQKLADAVNPPVKVDSALSKAALLEEGVRLFSVALLQGAGLELRPPVEFPSTLSFEEIQLETARICILGAVQGLCAEIKAPFTVPSTLSAKEAFQIAEHFQAIATHLIPAKRGTSARPSIIR